MKTLDQFDFNSMYPMHMEGEILYNRFEYRDFLLRKKYAYDPADAVIDTPVAKLSGSEITDKIDALLDVVESNAVKDFGNKRRGRKAKEVTE